MLDTISTAKMSHEEWLEERRKSIGGSDAAAVIGMSRFASPYTVWMDKTGRLPEKEDTEAMRIGRDLEEYVAKRFEEASGKKVRRCNYIIRNPAYPWAHADIDRRISGENAGLECKTTSTLDIRQFNGVEFPERYYAQCVHYLAVTGLDRWYLAVIVFGRGFFTYTLERDEAEISALMEAEKLFWRCVEEAGFRQQVRASATCVSMAASFRFFMKVLAAARPPARPKDTTPQLPLGRYFSASEVVPRI